ncbi:MAG TPA: hypothetical protein VN844_17820 [Pyrinomonadaceae bacterium]|nr:hypothetical protein [Pyrinomonadaceae bacterium]
MSEDLTKTLPASDSEKLTLILTTVQSLTVRADNIDSRLGRVEQTVHETRPILERVGADMQRVLADIGQLKEGQIEARAEILQLHEGQRALSTEVRALRRDIDHQFGNVHTKLIEIEIEHRDIHDRVTRLELNSTPPNTQT